MALLRHYEIGFENRTWRVPARCCGAGVTVTDYLATGGALGVSTVAGYSRALVSAAGTAAGSSSAQCVFSYVGTATATSSASAVSIATDPYAAQVVLFMKFNNDLVDIAGHSFAADGVSSYISDWLGGTAVSIGGATSGLGGANVIYSTVSSMDWALQGDFCIEAVGRINSNLSRPRLFLRLAQGATDIAQIGADSGIWKGSIRDGASSTHTFDGPSVVYGTPVHLALVREADEGRFYVDGVLASTYSFLSYVTPNVAADAYIGNNQRFFVDALDGDIAWVRVTNAARYPATAAVSTEPT